MSTLVHVHEAAHTPPSESPEAPALTPIQLHTRAIAHKASELVLTVTSGADLYEAGAPSMHVELVRTVEQIVLRLAQQVRLPEVMAPAPVAEPPVS